MHVCISEGGHQEQQLEYETKDEGGTDSAADH